MERATNLLESLAHLMLLVSSLSAAMPHQVLHDKNAASDEVDNDGRTPLHIAALNGHKDVRIPLPLRHP